jgi:hypothetical protein
MFWVPLPCHRPPLLYVQATRTRLNLDMNAPAGTVSSLAILSRSVPSIARLAGGGWRQISAAAGGKATRLRRRAVAKLLFSEMRLALPAVARRRRWYPVRRRGSSLWDFLLFSYSTYFTHRFIPVTV